MIVSIVFPACAGRGYCTYHCASLLEEERKGDAENSGPSEAGSDGEAHTRLSVGQRVDLGGVGERNGTFTGRVEGGEHEDEQADEASSDGAHALVHERAETSGQQSPEHLGECEEEQAAATEGVDGPEGGEAEEPVDETESERADHGNLLGEAGVDENGGGVEGDDVDTAELLGQHDSEGSQVGAADTGDGEELGEAGEVVGLAHKLVLDLELSADVVHITGDLEVVVAKQAHGLPGVGVAVLLHVPTRRLGAQVDEADQGHGGQERSSEHEAPVGRLRDVVHGEVDGGSQHDTEGGPELPRHDEGTSDGSGSVLSGVDGDGGGLETHADAHEQTAGELLGPGVAERRADDGPETEVTGDESGAAATEPVVDGVRDPAADDTVARRVSNEFVAPPSPRRGGGDEWGKTYAQPI